MAWRGNVNMVTVDKEIDWANSAEAARELAVIELGLDLSDVEEAQCVLTHKRATGEEE
jgi:hypothetical protein